MTRERTGGAPIPGMSGARPGWNRPTAAELVEEGGAKQLRKGCSFRPGTTAPGRGFGACKGTPVAGLASDGVSAADEGTGQGSHRSAREGERCSLPVVDAMPCHCGCV